MYNLIIVEDEHNIREAIFRFVKWEELGFHVAGLFTNGEEALEHVKQHRVNAILTDIRMPVMDGLELIKSVHEYNPDIKAVVLSGYDEFSYAQQSIRFGVFDYILKPVKFNVLSETLTRLREMMDRERSHIRMLDEAYRVSKEQFLNHVVKGFFETEEDIYIRAEELGIEIKSGSYCVVRIEIDAFYEENAFRDRALLKFSIRNILEEVVDKYSTGFVFSNDVPELCVLLVNAEDLEQVAVIFNEFREHILKFIGHEVTVSISSVYRNISLCRMAIEEAGKGLEKVYSDSGSRIIRPKPGETREDPTTLLGERIAEEIVSCLNHGDAEGLRRLILNKQAELKGQAPDIWNAAAFHTALLQLLSRYLKNVGKDMRSVIKGSGIQWKDAAACNSPDESFELILSVYTAVMKSGAGSQGNERRIVEKIKEYIKEHYNEEINLNRIAKHVYMNPSYISRLFKTCTGQNFIDFLTAVRMEKAMELLKNPGVRIYEVSGVVGYTNYRHFTEVFKKYTGLTAVEYREGRSEVKTTDIL